jgi:NAD(P)H dehydrogenase (quinone)
MSTLIIYTHPNHDGHHGYFLNRLISNLEEKKETFELVDLYKVNYNPVLTNEALISQQNHQVDEETKQFQNKIAAADKLILIYPTWWGNVPAVLKGFFDRVFTAGFAYTYKNGLPTGLLLGKKAAVFTATGSRRFIYRFIMRDDQIKIATRNVLKFSGFKAKGFSVGSALKMTDEKKKELDKAVTKLIAWLY